MTHFARRWLPLALATLLLAACAGGEDDAPAVTTPPDTLTTTATPTPAAPTPTAAPEPPAPAASPAFTVLELADPDVDRAYEDMRVLAVDIGVRSAGTADEREAAGYIASQLRDAGYVVEFEEFESTYRGDHSTLAAAGKGPSMQALALAGSRNGMATGALVRAGLGSPEAFRDVDVDGAIALLDRGLIPFRNKALEAQAAGAIGVVIVNSEPGLFAGTLGELSGVTIPVIGVSGRAREALRTLAEDGMTVTVTADVGQQTVTSQNVVGRNGECRGYLGAHYDSVPYGPGANDNASGTALIIELARTHRAEGLCVIAFGAEEVGLHGSRAFVDANDVSDALFLLNFDMVARIGQGAMDGARFIPSAAELSQRAAAVADRLGYGILPGDFPFGAASDHVSFADAGVPAITVHSGGYEFIHTSRDTIDTVYREDLAIVLEVSSELLRELLADPGG